MTMTSLHGEARRIGLSVGILSMVAWVSLGLGCQTVAEEPSEGGQESQEASYTDRFISVEGRRIHYLDWGREGQQPFVMLHGIARTAHSFDHIAPHFRQDFRVIAVDMRGHGDSDWHPEGAYLVEDYVKDIEALVEDLDLNDIVILGNSTGGRVAQVYAGLHPELVSRLIVEDVGPERPQNIASGFARRVAQEANGWASEEDLFEQLKAGSPDVSEELLRARAHYDTKRRDDGRIVWKRDPNLVKGFVPTELWRFIEKIASPTLYILGGDSPIVPPEIRERLKATIPDCQIVVFPGVGHYPDLERPDDYVAEVKRFLSRGHDGDR